MGPEKKLEQFCIRTVENLGGYAFKLSVPGVAGLPDRLILLPGGKIGFLELKTLKKKPTALQSSWLKSLTLLGFKSKYADSKLKIKNFILEL